MTSFTPNSTSELANYCGGLLFAAQKNQIKMGSNFSQGSKKILNESWLQSLIRANAEGNLCLITIYRGAAIRFQRRQRFNQLQPQHLAS